MEMIFIPTELDVESIGSSLGVTCELIWVREVLILDPALIGKPSFKKIKKIMENSLLASKS